MIRSLKLFADCVESLRTAEKKYEEEPTALNKRIVTDLQNKVDGWIVWIRKQEDADLAKNLPPFIRKTGQTSYPKTISKDLYDRLVASHTPEEVEKYTKMMNGNL